MNYWTFKSSLGFIARKYQKNIIARTISNISQLKQKQINDDISDIEYDYEDSNKEYEQLANKCFGYKEHNCFIIHPYIKWGPKKERNISPQNLLDEAIALVNTLTNWNVQNNIIVPLENFDKKKLFGSGALEKLKQQVRRNKQITAVFINIGLLRTVQLNELEQIFRVDVFDRYNIVMQILRLHATTKHAKLQVALAEIPYLRARLRQSDAGSNIYEIRKQMLKDREQKIKNCIQKLRSQRELLRNRRQKLDYPIVAIVGYTNCGKTSLIKSLTGEKELQPRNQLFATLDVTMHAGLLPSNLKILYVDTVGFISNIPTDLIECFVATLEDAMLADVIVHVQDVSNEDFHYQKKHVIETLQSLAKNTESENLIQKIISVGNKIDITSKLPDEEDMIFISAKNMTGIDILRNKIEEAVLKETGRIKLKLRVLIGSDEVRWLYKNATVIEETVDEKDNQYQFTGVIITPAKIKQFHHYFVTRN